MKRMLVNHDGGASAPLGQWPLAGARIDAANITDPAATKSRQLARLLTWTVAGLLALGISSSADASQERLYFWGFGGVEQLDILTDDDEASGSTSNLETGIVGEGALRYRNNYAALQSIRLETNVRAEHFPDHDDRSTERVRFRAEWRTWFSEARQTELRLRGEFEHKLRDSDWLTNRIRGQAELRHELNEEHLVFGRGQITDRDYNDDRSVGLDHVRYLGEVGHEWTPYHNRTRVRTRVGYETADADSTRFDYDGYYVAVDARHPIRPTTELFGRARATFRNYQGPFDPPDPLQRADERYRATVGVEQDITKHLSFVAEGGWASNEANVEERRYSGLVFRVGVELDFDIWRSED